MTLLSSDHAARRALWLAREAGPHGFITHPDDCAGLTILWTDHLLPGDPRC